MHQLSPSRGQAGMLGRFPLAVSVNWGAFARAILRPLIFENSHMVAV